MALELAHENIWFDKWRVEDAERQFYEKKSLCVDEIPSEILIGDHQELTGSSKAIQEITPQEEEEVTDVTEEAVLAQARSECLQEEQNESGHTGTAAAAGAGGGASVDVLNRITKLEGENNTLSKTVKSLEQTVLELTQRLAALECGGKTTTAAAVSPKKSEPMEADDDDDEEVDLFGSDDEEEGAEAARVREERIKAYADKKSKKPGPIAKSSVLLDCKPWDDETDMSAMEAEIRKIEMDGLKWGAAKLQPLAYGIMKLSILCTVEDEKVSIDDLSEKIQEIEDYVQSVDIAAFNKV